MSVFTSAQTASQILELLLHLPKNSFIFVDVDDTLIAPVSKAFRLPPALQIIDQIKEKKDHYPHYEKIVSQWRLQRQVQLLDKQWPHILESLKKNHYVFGLTKMDTGTFGVIESIERWRAGELAQFGIKFLCDFPFDPLKSSEQIIELEPERFHGPTFHQGIFFTGEASKADVLTLLNTNNQFSKSHIVLIDDRQEQLKAIEALCDRWGIPFIGILFEGARHLEGQADPHLVAFQQKYLLENLIWLEDDKAETYLYRR